MTTNDVRVEIYRSFIEDGRAPTPAEVAARLGVATADAVASFRELHDQDVIALAPGTDLVWLAHPFSAMNAAFEVVSGRHRWDGICVWDGLGILSMLKLDGTVATACPDCGDNVTLEVRGGDLVAPEGALVHYGVPAARWYEDVGYT
jgi:Alkylmercury lyase